MKVEKDILCIIPARGGSKGIPNKNILLLAGKPLVAYAIEAALQSSSVTRTVVSTDDVRIAAVAKAYGAEVVMRPQEISGDTASSESALLHVLEQFKKDEQYVPDVLVFLQCTSPLLIADDIDASIDILRERKVDTVFSVTPSHAYLWKQSNASVCGLNHDMYARGCRQVFEEQYLETGSIYVMNAERFLNRKQRFSDNMAFYFMPKERAVEIDDLMDWDVAEVYMRQRIRRERLSRLPDTISGVVFDFDGVFTDNTVCVNEKGIESVTCNRGDGWGITCLREQELSLLVLSTEKNNVVQTRCDKLQIPCMHGVEDKLAVLRAWCQDKNMPIEQVIFLGNDTNDLACIQAVGCGVVVADAHSEVMAHADMILQHAGGHGAVRELCDLILAHHACACGNDGVGSDV